MPASRKHRTHLLALALGVAALGCSAPGDVVDLEPSGAADDAYADVEDVRIELAVSGGIAGVGYAFVVDGASGEVRGLRCEAHCPFEAGETVAVVTAAQVAGLAEMLVDAGILALGPATDYGTQCCDQFHYVLTYVDGDVERSVEGSSEVLPEGLRSAVGTLHGLAHGVRPVVMDLLGSLEDWPRDPLALDSVSLEGSRLTLDVQYGGGCHEHVFDLVAWNGWLESFPVQVGIVLAHDDLDDACEALIRKELVFDLTPLRRAYQEAYGVGSATIILRLADPASRDPGEVRRIDYAF